MAIRLRTQKVIPGIFSERLMKETPNERLQGTNGTEARPGHDFDSLPVWQKQKEKTQNSFGVSLLLQPRAHWQKNKSLTNVPCRVEVATVSYVWINGGEV